MDTAIGFSIFWNATAAQENGAADALGRALSYFPNLKQQTVELGATRLILWGRGELNDCLQALPDGSRLALIGSPVGISSWQAVQDAFLKPALPEEFRFPWDGRAILLHIDASGNHWRIWNDWLGSIPVYYSTSPKQRIASTLEPVVVSANRYTSDQFYLPAIVSMLIHGHTFGDWTIFKDMKTLRPDSLSTFDEAGLRVKYLETVRATGERFERGWNDLVDEMHDLSRKAILEAFAGKASWIIPLSSGLDSRLIASVASEANIPNARAYTWGAATSQDVIYSGRIARALGLPWKQIPLSDTHLRDNVRQWADMFGSAMYFHGMYQFPFMKALEAEPKGTLITGYLGDALGGYDTRFQSEYHLPARRTAYALPPNWVFFHEDELKTFFKAPVSQAIECVAEEIHKIKNAIPGPEFQRLRFLTFWGRQSHFTYFQSMLADYWFGVAAPFINREYARFCLSLPRAVLDDRRMQIDMMRRYYPSVMGIPGSYAVDPAIMTGSFLMRRRLATRTPSAIGKRIYPEFFRTKNYATDLAAVKRVGEDAIWPIPQAKPLMADVFNIEALHSLFEAATTQDDIRSLRKLQTVQAIAYRFLSAAKLDGSAGKPIV